MDNDIDLLQIKIDNAKKQLPEETLRAIAAVPWQAEILKMRETKGYSFEQLGDLELETELLLCGLVSPSDYPKELENRMKISKANANELVAEMNELVFAKIKEEMIKNSERDRIFKKEEMPPSPSQGEGLGVRSDDNSKTPSQISPLAGGEVLNPDTAKEKMDNTEVLKRHGIEIISEKLELSTPSISSLGPNPKLAPQEGNNTTPLILAQKMSGPVKVETVKTEHTLENITKIPKIDPYREIPE